MFLKHLLYARHHCKCPAGIVMYRPPALRPGVKSPQTTPMSESLTQAPATLWAALCNSDLHKFCLAHYSECCLSAPTHLALGLHLEEGVNAACSCC